MNLRLFYHNPNPCFTMDFPDKIVARYCHDKSLYSFIKDKRVWCCDPYDPQNRKESWEKIAVDLDNLDELHLLPFGTPPEETPQK